MAFDFPNNPTIGTIVSNTQSGENFEWDGVAWIKRVKTVQNAFLSKSSSFAEIAGIASTYGRTEIDSSLSNNQINLLAYYSGSKTVTTLYSTMSFGTTLVDNSNGQWDNANNIFIANTSANYRVSSFIQSGFMTTPNSRYMSVQIMKNTSIVARADDYNGSNTTNGSGYFSPQTSVVVSVVPGDTIWSRMLPSTSTTPIINFNQLLIQQI